jgi:hypothetical protein
MAYTIGQLQVWPFKPNRTTPITETLDWLTDVIVAYRGDEQRIGLRAKPRRSFEYASRTSGSNSQRLGNILWGWQSKPFALPIWNNRGELSSSESVGSSVLDVITSNLGFSDGGFALIFSTPSSYELVQINGVTTTELSLVSPTTAAWSAGSHIYPVDVARLPLAVQSRQITSVTTEITSVFTCDSVVTNSNLPVVAPSLTYGGYEVVLKKQNWAQPIDTNHEFNFAEIDYQTGATARFDQYDTPKITKRYQWLLRNSQDQFDFRALITRLSGRLKAVYMPTWLGDFSLYSTELSTATSIKVKSNEFQQMVGVDPALDTIAIIVDGVPVIKTINAVTLGSSFTTLGLTTTIGVDLTQENVSMISLIRLCRLTADRVTINHLTSEVATVELNFTTVKA